MISSHFYEIFGFFAAQHTPFHPESVWIRFSMISYITQFSAIPPLNRTYLLSHYRCISQEQFENNNSLTQILKAKKNARAICSVIFKSQSYIDVINNEICLWLMIKEKDRINLDEFCAFFVCSFHRMKINFE